MRVAIILPPREAFSPAAAGGIGLVVQRLARAAATDVSSVVVGPPTVLPPFAKVDFRPARPAVWAVGNGGRRYAHAVAQVLHRLAPDLIEVHNRPDVALSLAAQFRPTPCVLFLHNHPHGMRRAATPAERHLLLARLARVVSVSAFLRGLLLEGIGESERALVLPNPIERGVLPKPLPPQERHPLILFVGRMVSDKGADTFVTAAAAALPHLPGWRAEMYGADRFGPASPDTPYLALLSRRAALSAITLHGYRPQAEVAAAMAKAAIVVVPSRWPEPFGLTALEAMAGGAALIASPRGALPEIAGQAARYADPDDPQALAESIVALARDAPARAALAAAGLARAAAFDLPRVGAALTALRADILAS